MNLVGKIFIVLILVMALVWMGLSVAVYAAHKNWKDHVENPTTGLNKQLEEAKARTQQLKDEATRLMEADITQIAVDLSQREVLYQMSLSVAGKLMSTTLLDFLR